MTDKEEIAQLKAELAKAKAAPAPVALTSLALRTQAELDGERKLAANAELRAKLQAKTLKRGDAFVYLVGPEKAYREGRLYRAGEEIELPKNELPSITFLAIGKDGQPIDGDGKPAEKPSAAPVKGTGRPSDEDI